MSYNRRMCVNCGRLFQAANNKRAFCSQSCKKMYGNYISFNCRTCRNARCTARNNYSMSTPAECENLKNKNRV